MIKSNATAGRLFSQVSLTLSATCACLASVYIFCPNRMFWLFGMTGESASFVMARRGGALYLGVSILLYRIRTTDDRNARIAVSLGLATACAALATLGAVDLFLRNVKAGISIAIVIEISFVFFYIAILRKEGTW